MNSESEPIQFCTVKANLRARSLQQSLAPAFKQNRPQEDTLGFQLFIFMLLFPQETMQFFPSPCWAPVINLQEKAVHVLDCISQTEPKKVLYFVNANVFRISVLINGK